MTRFLSVILATLLALAAACAARAQGMNERLPAVPSFYSLLTDLRTAQVAIEPEALLSLYVPFIVAWSEEQDAARAALARAAGADGTVIPSPEEVHRAVTVVRRARSAHEAQLERFFLARAEAAPESERAKVNLLFDWRRDGGMGHWYTAGFMLSEDVGATIRGHPLPEDRREAILAALDANRSARRDAYRRFDRAYNEARAAQAALAAAEGMIGTPLYSDAPLSDEHAQFLQRYRAAGAPDPAAIAAILDTQMAAFDTVAPHLPEDLRRSVFDGIVRRHLAGGMHGGSLNLPQLGPGTMQLDTPALAAQALLAWTDLPRGKRDAVRELVRSWLAEDDALLREHFAQRSAAMQAGTWDPSRPSPDDFPNRRRDLARAHLLRLAEESGAAWLTNRNTEPIPRDRKGLEAADLALVGLLLPAVADSPPAHWAASPVRLRRERLPASNEDAVREEFLRGLAAALRSGDPEAQTGAEAITADLLRDHRDAWEERVTPEVEAALAADRNSLAGTLEERRAAVAASALHRVRAFEAARAVDRALIESVAAALPSKVDFFLARWFASRRFEEGLAGLERDSRAQLSLDLERFGGSMINLAGLLDSPHIPPAARRAIEVELAEEWPKLADAAVDALDVRLAQHARARELDLGISEGDHEQIDRDHQDRGAVLRALIDAWRTREDALEPHMLAAAGDEAAVLASVLEEARFPGVCSSLTDVRRIREALADAPDFAGRDALLAALDAGCEDLQRLARRSIALSLPRQPIAHLTRLEAQRLVADRSWRHFDLVLGANEITTALQWLVGRRMPPEFAERSETLARAARFGAMP